MRIFAPILAAAIVGVAWWWTRRGTDPVTGETDNAPDAIDYAQVVMGSAENMIGATVDQSSAAANLAAFLLAIRARESGPDDSAYLIQCGGTYASSYAEHPALLGWRGLPLSDALCAGAGFGPGCVSTAAGAYQITKPTWTRLRDKLGLVDFSPASQDAAAVEPRKGCPG
jgi:muramidase (phage lysozyme)